MSCGCIKSSSVPLTHSLSRRKIEQQMWVESLTVIQYPILTQRKTKLNRNQTRKFPYYKKRHFVMCFSCILAKYWLEIFHVMPCILWYSSYSSCMCCMCLTRPGWSPAGGMIPACIRPLWDSMWCVPPSVTLCSLLGGRPGLELKAKKKHSLKLVIRPSYMLRLRWVGLVSWSVLQSVKL